jgi:hypothetical protein
VGVKSEDVGEKNVGMSQGRYHRGQNVTEYIFFLRQNVTRTFCGWTFRQGIIKTSSLESMCDQWPVSPNMSYFLMSFDEDDILPFLLGSKKYFFTDAIVVPNTVISRSPAGTVY